MSLLKVPHYKGHAISCLLRMGSLLGKERELSRSCSSPLTFSKLTPGLCLLPGDFLSSCTVLIQVPRRCFFPVPPRVTGRFVIVGLSQEKLWLPCFFLSMHLAHWLVTV